MQVLKYIFFVILLSLQTNSFSDPFSWAGEDITTQTGSLSNLKDAQKIKYKFGYRSGGFGHLESAIEISWCNLKGDKYKQIIFREMTDWTIEKIRTDYSNSIIKIYFKQPCDPDPEDILQPPLTFKYNTNKQIFERVK